jgi:DNA primase
MNAIEEIKSRLDLVDVVSETVSLRKSGRSYSGFCPFHPNTRTPAFVVFPETQSWRCFGACAEGGDIFNFVMKREGWDFKETLQHLADKAGVVLEELTPAQQQKQAEQERLVNLLAATADYFHLLLLHAPQAEFARQYVAGRGLDDKTIETFKVGFALNSWDACRNHFNDQGYSDDELVAAGLLTENQERNTRYDRFRNRLMIPIRDVSGRVVGFGARTLDPDGVPKYLNSPQTELFDKSTLLFGLDMGKRHIREARQAVIVEGYMDVMQGWQMGFRNMVAQMGTALTEAQLQLLKRYTRRFVIALDADVAGFQATMRSLEVAREALDRDPEVGFNAKYLIQHEGRLRADIRIATLPEGHDPDNLIREDPTQWPQLVAAAKPVVEYVIDILVRELDSEDAKEKVEIVSRVMPLIQDVANPVERDHYRQLLARKLRVDERVLQQVAVKPAAKPGQRKKRKPLPPEPEAGLPMDGGPPMDAGLDLQPGFQNKYTVALRGGRIAMRKREAYYLGECLQAFPEMFQRVDASLQSVGQEPVREVDFTSIEDRALWRSMHRVIQEQRLSNTVATFDELWDILDETVRGRAAFLLEKVSAIQENPVPNGRVRLPDLLAASILDLRLERIHRQLSELQQLVRDSRQSGDVEASALFLQQMQALPMQMQRIQQARQSFSTVHRRESARKSKQPKSTD